MPGDPGLTVTPVCSSGAHFLSRAARALPSCPRSLDFKWCWLPHLRYAHGPADQDLACAPWDTLHALISAVPCLRSSLSNMLPHPQHRLLSQPIRKHCPLCVQLPKRSFHSRPIARWQCMLVFPFLSNATSCSNMNCWSPVDESVRLYWVIVGDFPPKRICLHFYIYNPAHPFQSAHWHISFWRYQNSELISSSFIGMLC